MSSFGGEQILAGIRSAPGRVQYRRVRCDLGAFLAFKAFPNASPPKAPLDFSLTVQRVAPADAHVPSKPNFLLSGVVDGVGFGVTPDADVVGRFEPGLPNARRTLNWVHLASRYPVRVRVENPPPELIRVSESAVVVVRGC